MNDRLTTACAADRSSRRRGLVATLALLAIGCGATEPEERSVRPDPKARAPAATAAPPRASVLLLTIDTLRADHLGSYGHPEPISPEIDALARRGVVFERAVAASSRTAPSHASILTSRFVRDHAIGSVNGATRLEHEPTLATLLSARGYATAAFVSNTVLQRHTGLDRGFDLYDDQLTEREDNRGEIFERRAPDTAERALAWLAGAKPPWLAWVHFNDPHGPYDAPAPHTRHPQLSGFVRGPARDRPEKALPVLDEQSGRGGIPAYQVQGELRMPREYRARYAAEIRFTDAQVGRLLAGAERAAGSGGLIVLLTSDHGESLGEEGVYFAHGNGTAPDLAHVPFILVAPGLAPGRESGLVHHVDVLPTLLERLGLEPPPGSAGLALARARRDPLPSRSLYTDVGHEVSAYRDDRFERLRVDPYRRESLTYRWSVDAGWQPTGADAALQRDLASYAERSAPLSRITMPDAAERQRLRALGYVPPPSPAEASREQTELGIAAEQRGDHARAIEHYRKALEHDPQQRESTNNLAWLLATTRPELREPETAIELAERALARDPGSPAILDTLAAAYAAAGRAPDAVRTQQQALERLRTADPSIRADFEARLASYQRQLADAAAD
jgi:arylsulfatase